MTGIPYQESLVLSVAPNSYGFGFVLFEGPHTPIDWGVRYLAHGDRENLLLKLDALLSWYQPDVLVVEDCATRERRRATRVRRMLRDIVSRSARHLVETRRFTRAEVRLLLSRFGATTKREIAEAVVEILPEFSVHLPPKRKLWLPEHPRMSMFEAIALSLTYYATMDDDFRTALIKV